MTLRESLHDLSPIPIPQVFLTACGQELGVDLDAMVSGTMPQVEAIIKSRIFLWLATHPSISEGGVSVSFTAEDKRIFLALARKYAALGGEPELIPGASYGYKGENL